MQMFFIILLTDIWTLNYVCVPLDCFSTIASKNVEFATKHRMTLQSVWFVEHWHVSDQPAAQMEMASTNVSG